MRCTPLDAPFGARLHLESDAPLTDDERFMMSLGVYRPLTEAERMGETPLGAGVPDPGLAARRQLAVDYVIADEAQQLEAAGRSADYAYDPDYIDLRGAYPGFTPADVADMMDVYKGLDEYQRQAMLDDYGYYLEQRYLLSRVWGATQRGQVGIGSRIIHLAAAPIFPFFLLARIGRQVIQKGRLVGDFIKCLPLLVPVILAYTWGEFLGYLVGAGDALERVE
jgi:hypothetical protein